MDKLVRLVDALPCVARHGWDYCGQPATVARVVLKQTATGHYYELRPLCTEHQDATLTPFQGRK